MNFDGNNASGSFTRFIYLVGAVMAIILMYFQIQEYIGPNTSNQALTEPGTLGQSAAGFGGDINYSPSQSSGQNSSQQVALSIPNLQVPNPGEVKKNPIRFQWGSQPNIYFMIVIRDSEPDKEYLFQSQWVQQNTVDLNLPDQAIGNLEWRIIATTDPTGTGGAESGWRHFTFDPFHENKERQDEGSE